MDFWRICSVYRKRAWTLFTLKGLCTSLAFAFEPSDHWMTTETFIWSHFVRKICPYVSFLVLLVSQMASSTNKFVTIMKAPPNECVTQLALSTNLLSLLNGWLILFGGERLLSLIFLFWWVMIWFFNMLGDVSLYSCEITVT